MDIVYYLSQEHGIILNEQQKDGVLSNYKNTLLLAVPGSGKTTVLVSRIANLIINYKVSQSSILTLTFGNESVRDMKNRFNLLFGKIIDNPPQFQTIHSLCYSAMKLHSKKNACNMPTLISQNKGLKQRVLREIYMKLNGEYLTDDMYETLDEKLSYVKNMMLNKSQILKIEETVPCFFKIIAEYEQFKKQNNLYEYDDMLVYTYRLFTNYPELLSHFTSKYTHVNVDEAQDTSLIQHKIIKLLTSTNSLFMVGDEDQCIYTFRGAYPQALLEFDSLYEDATVIKMEQNFRSNSDIILLANEFIKQNKHRYEKDMYCDNKKIASTEIIVLSDYCKQYNNIVQYICKRKSNESIAVLYRNNYSAIPLIDLLYKEGINYYSKDSKQAFFTCNTVRDIIAYIRLSFNQCDVEAFSQLYYKMGLSKGVYAFVKDNISRYDSVFSAVNCLDTVKEYRKDELNYYRFGFQKLSKMKPTDAIEYICTTLGYERFIETKLSDSSARTFAYQRIGFLLSIADNLVTLKQLFDKLEDLNMKISDRKNIDANSNLTVSTIHSSKGMEFDTVILIDVIKDIIPTADAVRSHIMGDNMEHESEVRLFYVAITRAKTKLIVYKSSRLNKRPAQPSSYIERYFGEKGNEKIE